MSHECYELMTIKLVVLLYATVGLSTDKYRFCHYRIPCYSQKYRPVLVKHDVVIYFSTQVLGVKTGSEILARLAF